MRMLLTSPSFGSAEPFSVYQKPKHAGNDLRAFSFGNFKFSFIGLLRRSRYTFPRGEGGRAKRGRKRNSGDNLGCGSTLRLSKRSTFRMPYPFSVFLSLPPAFLFRLQSLRSLRHLPPGGRYAPTALEGATNPKLCRWPWFGAGENRQQFRVQNMDILAKKNKNHCQMRGAYAITYTNGRGRRTVCRFA